jgi:transposase
VSTKPGQVYNFPNGKYHLAYEAGFAGNWIARAFRDRSIDCIVVNPADIPINDKERRHKTDARDCRKIARSLRANELQALYVPSEQAEDDRQLVRTRSAMVRKQTRVKNQIKAALHHSGTPVPDRCEMSHWSRGFITWLQGLFDARASRKQSMAVYIEELLALRQQINDVTRKIRALAQTDGYRPIAELLVSIPGISMTSAMIVITELVDVKRFKDLDHLASYVGLIPGTDSSGETERTTGLTKRRNNPLRVVLIESAWTTIRLDPEMQAAFERTCRRMAKNRAIIVIARKLLSRIHHLLVHKQAYQINNAHHEVEPREHS